MKNENKKTLPKGITMYYGYEKVYSDYVIAATVKGKFKPVNERADYTSSSMQTQKTLKRASIILLDGKKSEYHLTRYMFESDFTEKGISMEKPCKFKYTLYMVPNCTVNDEICEAYVTETVNEINGILENAMTNNGLEITGYDN